MAVSASVAEIAAALATGDGDLMLIDIRKKPDDAQIPGSVRYNGEELQNAGELPFSQDDPVVLYCGSGNSCSRIAADLRARGYNARALEGGYAAWRDAGMETESISEQRKI